MYKGLHDHIDMQISLSYIYSTHQIRSIYNHTSNASIGSKANLNAATISGPFGCFRAAVQYEVCHRSNLEMRVTSAFRMFKTATKVMHHSFTGTSKGGGILRAHFCSHLLPTVARTSRWSRSLVVGGILVWMLVGGCMDVGLLLLVSFFKVVWALILLPRLRSLAVLSVSSLVYSHKYRYRYRVSMGINTI